MNKVKRDIYEHPASFFHTRLIAFFIDSFIIGIVTWLIFGAGRDLVWFVGFLINFGYHWLFWTTWRGQSPGKRVMSIRIVKIDGTEMTPTEVLLRVVGYYINSAVFMIGWIWAGFDKDSRGWHDYIAGTMVIRE